MSMFASSEISTANIAPAHTGEFLVSQDNMPVWNKLSGLEQNLLKKFVHDCSRNCFSGNRVKDFANKANWMANAYLDALRTGEFKGCFKLFLQSDSILISYPKQMPVGQFLAR